MALEKDVRDAIEKNLPGAVGNILKERLEQAEVDANRAKSLEGTNSTLTRENSDIRARLGSIEMRESQVTQREKSVGERELKADLNEYKVTAYMERLNDFRGILNAVFANSKLKYTESGSVPVANPPGGYGTTSAPTSRSGEREE